VLLDMGASVKICPLYLPDAGKNSDELIEGISVAKPPLAAGRLLDINHRILTF